MAPVLSAILPRERVLFLGENGCGKSVLARLCLDVQHSYVIVDTKRDFPRRSSDELVESPEDKRLSDPERRFLHYRPHWRYLHPAWTTYVLHRLAERAYRYGANYPFILYVDEGLDQSRRGDKEVLASLQVTTRSLQVGMWLSSQRPVNIPVELRSECHRWLIFTLGDEEDEVTVLRYMKRQLSLEELQASTSNHSFIEVRRDPERPGRKIVTRFPPVDYDPGLYVP